MCKYKEFPKKTSGIVENEILLVSRNFFFVYYDFKNVCKNEFEDYNEKLCS